MTTQPEGADVAFPLWVARVTRHPLGDRPHVQAYFPRCACGERKVKVFFTKKLTTLASLERSLVAKVKMGSVLSVRAADRTPPKPHPRRVSTFFVLCSSRFACAAALGARDQSELQQGQGSRCQTKRHNFAVRGDGAWPGDAHRC